MKKVLVTGGAGFIGFHLARRLSLRYEVDLLDNLSRGHKDADLKNLLRTGRVRLVKADLLSGKTAGLGTDYTLMFHLAAKLGVANVAREPLAVLKDNFMLVSAALDLALRQTSLRRFLFASTSEVYAGTLEAFGVRFPTPEMTPLTIADPSRPRAAYLLSKIAGEALCHHSRVPFTIVRPHNVYGPRMGKSHVIPELLDRAWRADSTLTVYSPGHRRVFCYVEDAVRQIELAAESKKTLGQTLNVGSLGPEIKMRDLARLICAVVGKKLGIRNGGDTTGSPVRRFPDMKKALRLTGYRGPWVELEEGIRRTAQWTRKT